jgi:hypothetical protein
MTGDTTDFAGRVVSDPDALRGWLSEQTFDLRGLDPAGFRRWLGARLDRWQSDPVFVLRTRIRDLRKAHPELRRLEREYRRAEAADAATPQAARLRDLGRELHNTDKAIAGLSRAGDPAKLDAFRTTRARLEAERDALVASSPGRQELLRLAAELAALRAAIGLDRLEADLAAAQTGRGRLSGRSGESFEDVARAMASDHLCEPGTRLLRGVRLGTARTEFDLLVARVADNGTADVVAVVEAKRNPNDLARGFLHRQADLAWLTGERDRYDPADYRTKTFPTGHFDRPSEHREEGTAVRFVPSSFRRFRRDPASGFFLHALHLVTRIGPLWGVSGNALSRIAARVATDEDWNPDDTGYLEVLRAWCQSLAGPIETPDMVRLYANAAGSGRLLAVPS